MPDYSLTHAHLVAATMLKRYSTYKVASDMAHYHAMDYPRHSEEREFWKEVGREISRLYRKGT